MFNSERFSRQESQNAQATAWETTKDVPFSGATREQASSSPANLTEAIAPHLATKREEYANTAAKLRRDPLFQEARRINRSPAAEVVPDDEASLSRSDVLIMGLWDYKRHQGLQDPSKMEAFEKANPEHNAKVGAAVDYLQTAFHEGLNIENVDRFTASQQELADLGVNEEDVIGSIWLPLEAYHKNLAAAGSDPAAQERATKTFRADLVFFSDSLGDAEFNRIMEAKSLGQELLSAKADYAQAQDAATAARLKQAQEKYQRIGGNIDSPWGAEGSVDDLRFVCDAAIATKERFELGSQLLARHDSSGERVPRSA